MSGQHDVHSGLHSERGALAVNIPVERAIRW